MTDDEALPPKTVRVGGQPVAVTNADVVEPMWADLITELRYYEGILYVSLANYILDGSGPPEARVCARLRMPITVVSDIQSGIERAIAETETAKQAAN